jgi:RHS repeat-associated protein
MVVNAKTSDVAQSIDYDAWGNVLSETGAGFQPFGFAGGLYDVTTELVRFGARDYDPATGRWTAKDVIGFAGRQANQYAYVNGEPVNRVDPGGRSEMGSEVAGSMAGAGIAMLATGTAVSAIGFINWLAWADGKMKRANERTSRQEEQLRELDKMNGVGSPRVVRPIEERWREHVYLEGFGEGLCVSPDSPCYESE